MSSVAFLPMYAVRGTQHHADMLWNCLRDSIRNGGIEAPEQVAHFAPRLEGWLHPDLILGQTCGLPYITKLCNSVELVGAPDHGVEGCPPGFYHSTLVASSTDSRTLPNLPAVPWQSMERTHSRDTAPSCSRRRHMCNKDTFFGEQYTRDPMGRRCNSWLKALPTLPQSTR